MKTNLKISIIYITYRPGGLDLLLDSLKNQTYTNYELIVVDDYPSRDLANAFKEENIPLKYYGPSKTKVLDVPFGQANAFNTGVLQAEGDLVLNINDYTWFPPEALKRWNDIFHQKTRNVISGIADVYDYNGRFKVDELSIFDPPFDGDFSRFSFNHHWNPTEWELFYSIMPISFLKAINGADERGDYEATFLYYSLLQQAKNLNYIPLVDHENRCTVINHRTWQFDDPKLWHIVRMASPTKSWEEIPWSLVSPNSFTIGS